MAKMQAESYAEQQAKGIHPTVQRAKDEMDMNAVKAEYDARMAEMPKKIGVEQIRKATEILKKYKGGKERLDAKIVANEEFWKLRQWNFYKDNDRNFKPATAWLWKMIQARHSDIMDSYPTCNFLPRQEDDKAEAKKLSAIIPVILEQNRYEDTYSDIAWYCLKNGGCVQGIFWDGSKHNGLGDVAVKKIDFLNFFYEPGITDIQKSENVFTTELVSNAILEQRYPQTKGHLGENTVSVKKYLYDDHVDVTDKSVVIDWYYHTYNEGKKVLHYVKFVGDTVLYATENMTEIPTESRMDEQTGVMVNLPIGEPLAVKGLYDHGMYPFVVQQLYPIEGSLCGYGLTDIGRDTQMQIDIMNKAVTDNVVVSATPRFFIKNDGSVNEEEFADMGNTFIHVNGSLNEDNIRVVDSPVLPTNCVNELQMKIDEMKYITSNVDVNNGAAPSGITAASAIATLAETAGKDSRNTNRDFYRTFKEVCYMITELVRQFYDTPRTFRIAPDTVAGQMGEEFVQFSNQGIKPQQQMINGLPNGFRVPEFDIEITAEKASTYKKMEQNELALNFYNLGFFNPQMADQAMACLEMMDFSHKEDVMKRIQMNGTLQQMLLQYQQIALQLAQQINPQLADQIGSQILSMGGQNVSPMGDADGVSLDSEKNDEHPYVERARQQADESTRVQ